MKKLLFFWKSNFNARVEGESAEPRGVHHTVSFASSYEETWDHIRSTARNAYTESANLAPERLVAAQPEPICQ